MQNMKIIVTKDMEEKLATRPLYEQAFDDPKGFVDYYYDEKMKDNTVVICKDGERIVSMLHLNPYTIAVNGREASVYYIVAVATDKAYRRQGCMRKVLKAAFDEMIKEEIPFCFLLPVDESIYRDFGFETICAFFARGDARSTLPYEAVQREYDVYAVRDALYEKRKRMEDVLAGAGDTELLPANPVIMAKIIHTKACAQLFGIKDDDGLPEYLKTKRCFFREEV